MNSPSPRLRASQTAWLLLLLALSSALSSCAASRRDWRELEVQELRFDQLWKITGEAMSVGLGLRIDDANSDRGLREIRSQWRVRHHGFKPSERLRLRIEIDRLEEPKGAHLVRYYAEREIVDDPARRLDPTEEDWEAGGQSGGLEELFAFQLRSRIALLRGEDLPSPSGTRPEDPMLKDKRNK
jgi:hypothetical protein